MTCLVRHFKFVTLNGEYFASLQRELGLGETSLANAKANERFSRLFPISSVLESGFCRLSAVNDPGECLGFVRGSTDTVLSQGKGVNAQQSCHGSCPCLVMQQRHCEQEVSYSWAGGHDFSPVHSDSRPSVRSFFSSSDGPGVRILPVPSRLWLMVTIRMEFKTSHICIFLC